jgi:hypothetical protein
MCENVAMISYVDQVVECHSHPPLIPQNYCSRIRVRVIHVHKGPPPASSLKHKQVRVHNLLNSKGEEEEMHAIHFIGQTTMQELTRVCVCIHNTHGINMPWFVL